MAKNYFKDGYVFSEGCIIIKGVTYEGVMPVEGRAEYRDEEDIAALGSGIRVRLDDTISKIEMRWGTKWFDNIEDVVAAKLMHVAYTDTPAPLYEALLEASENMEKEDAEAAEIVAWMRKQTWSNFLQDLCKWYDEHGSLTVKQLEVAKKVVEKTMASRTPTALSGRSSGKTAALDAAVAAAKAEGKTVKTVGVTAPKPKAESVEKAAGFYRGSGGVLYKCLKDPVALYIAMPPDEYGQALQWEESRKKEIPGTVVYLSFDNVVGFGTMNGTCLFCGEPLTEDNDEGLHDACLAGVLNAFS